MNESAERARNIIENYNGKKIRIMEVCGTHTHEIFRQGIRKLLPHNIQLISGPGCPVCVTPVSFIDEAVWLSENKHATICTFGDLMRVPGTEKSMLDVRRDGGKVQIVYTPLDAEKYAEENPSEKVVFLSVGFETTTPASCLAVRNAAKAGLDNFSILTANKTMDHAYPLLADSTDAYLYPGHVQAIMGTAICKRLLKSGISGVVAGFTAAELLTAIATCVTLLQDDKPFFCNCYPRVVTDDGSPAARVLMQKYMEPIDAEWRGIGMIPGSGLKLRNEFSQFDARLVFDIPVMHGHSNPACHCGEILRGNAIPSDCPLFGKVCIPEHPIGACMVSREGTCSAYYQYGRN